MGAKKQSSWRGQLALALGYNAVLWSLVGLALWTPAPLPTAAGVVGFFLGAALGSWLNQAVYRLPRGIPLDDPPSSCPRCQTPIRRIHNIPLLGWVLLRGRCASCGAAISWHYPAVELLVAVLFAAGAAFIVWAGS